MVCLTGSYRYIDWLSVWYVLKYTDISTHDTMRHTNKSVCTVSISHLSTSMYCIYRAVCCGTVNLGSYYVIEKNDWLLNTYNFFCAILTEFHFFCFMMVLLDLYFTCLFICHGILLYWSTGQHIFWNDLLICAIARMLVTEGCNDGDWVNKYRVHNFSFGISVDLYHT